MNVPFALTYSHDKGSFYEIEGYIGTVTSGLSENLTYPTLCCESPSLLCVQSTLIYPTPGLSDTICEKRMWLDKRGSTVCTYVRIRMFVRGTIPNHPTSPRMAP